jgi:tetratricopeptide (TPR) repeat protein/cellulose biosynthesis protein BcsQ
MTTKTLGKIITFYSYKGGTGRSMALANTACLLAQAEGESNRVLMMDWDLEAPGLHRFFRNHLSSGQDTEPQQAVNDKRGLIELFGELRDSISAVGESINRLSEEDINAIISKVKPERFILDTDIESLHLLKAGRFDDKYALKVSEFAWKELFGRAPSLIRLFANYLAQQFDYVLVDSRTGLTDTSGICTMLMPEKLVIVFTPNYQSLEGVRELVRRATNYRSQSDDLRPLVVLPLPSRIEATEPKLRHDWRFGNAETQVVGYQPLFQDSLKEAYGLEECNLEAYFKEVQIQHVPVYAYGEEIAVLIEKGADRLSLTESYKTFTDYITQDRLPWKKESGPKGIRLGVPPRNPFFTGRDDVLLQLRQAFTSVIPDPVQLQAVSGLGGIGKTQTIIEYAYRYQSEYKAVLWATADSRNSLISDYVKIAGLLKLPEMEAREQTWAVAAVKRWLESNDGWLLIFDNADDPQLVKEFLPNSFQGHILLTSGLSHFDWRYSTKALVLDALSPDDALAFMLKRTERESASPEERDAAVQLAGELGHLPLAMEEACAYVASTKALFQDYLSSYRTRGLELLEKASPTGSQYPHSIATTWTLIFDQVEKISTASADLLRASAFLNPERIPMELVRVGAAELGPAVSKALTHVDIDPLVLDELVEPLIHHSLIRRDPESQTYDIHRLVQAVLRDRMEISEQKLWAERTIKAVDRVFPEDEFVNWPQCERLIQHAQACYVLIERFQLEFEEAAHLLNRAGHYLRLRARYADAEPLLFQSLAMSEKLFGSMHPKVAEGQHNLGSLYYDQGKYSDAEPYFARALSVREQTLGPDHPDVATSLNDLAIVLHDQGRFPEAEPLYRRALAIREKAPQPDLPGLATSLNSLAMLYEDQGNYAEAAPLMVRSLDIRRKAFGAGHPDVAISLNNLGMLAYYQGKYADAEPLLERALAIREKFFGTDHPDVATSLNNLALLYETEGDHQKAEPLYLRSLKIRERALGQDHPDVAMSLNNIAMLKSDMGNYQEAEQLLRRSLLIKERRLGADHPDTAMSLNNLAWVCHAQHKYAEAEQLYKHALQIREKTLGPDHSEVADTLENYATLLDETNRRSEAGRMWNRAEAIQIKLRERRKGTRTSKDIPVLITHRDANSKAAIIFIHGFGGDPTETWGSFPDLLTEEESTSRWDIYSLGYQSKLRLDLVGIWAADPDIPKLALYMRTVCDTPPLDSYKNLVIIAHSMGGLVVQRALLDYDDLLKRVSHVFLFGTPSGGLKKVSLFQRLKRQFRDMAHDGPFIKDMRSRWKKKFGPLSDQKPPFKFWSVAGDCDEFVPAESSLKAFPENTFPNCKVAVVRGNHLDIVKPDDSKSMSFQIVVKGLRGRAAITGPWNSAAVAVESRNFLRAVELLEPNKNELDDAALVQLALALEGIGRQDDALKLLEERNPSTTDAIGVLAGRIKRRWLAERRDSDAKKARALYARAFQMAEAANDSEQAYYHGINVAFMDLASGDNRRLAKKQARDMALKVLEHCRKSEPHYWRFATEGDAHLLLGETEAAMENYQKVLEQEPPPRDIESVYQQAVKVADLLGDRAAAAQLDEIFRRGVT